MNRFDVITVGGGLAGASLAKGLAERGCKVLVLEREESFKDRVRGEQIHPWGIAELRALGLYDQVREACGHELPWFDLFLGPNQMFHRDLSVTTPQGAPELSFYHPAMQETILRAAETAGAEVRRGVNVTSVEPGSRPKVTIDAGNGATEELEARLVVGADGRRSILRSQGRFEVHQDPPGRKIAGVLLANTQVPTDTSHVVLNPVMGRVSALFPQGNGRMRAYLGYSVLEDLRLSGHTAFDSFVEESVAAGVPSEYFEGGVADGPLAAFDAADTWIDHPYRDGVALIGDAAASNDPSFGEGLSLTVRDARVLRDRLLEQDDWEKAGDAYAEEHDRHYGVIHEVSRWFSRIFIEPGSEADALRARALPLIASDPQRVPDHLFSGPDLPLDDGVRRRFFGED
jgi:2-polyprenyl-6-methoxyphenol hydroxylase-like FAD-dependent oxidoreductase